MNPDAAGLLAHRTRVFLVDDQPIIGESIRLTLAPLEDIDFQFCSDPLSALERAEEFEPTVILQDLVMPGIDGLDLVSRFREHEATKHVPLVVLSTREDPAVKASAFRRGASDYLVKLPSAVELIARLRYHSSGYIAACQRRLAFEALLESREQLRQRNAEIERQRDELARQAAELSVRNRFIRQTFGRYLSDEVVASLLASPEALELGGQSRVVTILMSDLRGFTSVADHLVPTQVVWLLNNYLGAMADVITSYRGTVNEFIGDAILALFGAPAGADDDSERAVACAIAMQRAMAGVNERNAREGLPPLEMGIAVNTGEVVVGNIGSETRAKYGIVGSQVNLTARIESMTVGGQVLISESTQIALGERAVLGQKQTIRAKGLADPVTTYELLGLRGSSEIWLPAPKDSDLVELEPPLPVVMASVREKEVANESSAGMLVELGQVSARILCTAEAPPAFSDLVIRGAGQDGRAWPAEIYAKVIERSEQTVLVRFTSVPASAAREIEKVLSLSGRK